MGAARLSFEKEQTISIIGSSPGVSILCICGRTERENVRRGNAFAMPTGPDGLLRWFDAASSYIVVLLAYLFQTYITPEASTCTAELKDSNNIPRVAE